MIQHSRGHTVLVADDQSEVVNLVRIVLEQEGFDVISAADGEEAVQRAQVDQPDLIILDLRMPKQSGLVVLDRLRAEPATAGIPVIMLSVVTSATQVQTALERGALAYFTKPFELHQVVSLTARVLEMDATEREALRQRSLKSTGGPW